MKFQNTMGQKSKRHQNFSFWGQGTQKHGWPDLPSFCGLSADGAIDTVKRKIRGGPWLQGLIICNLSFHLQKKNSSSFKMFVRIKKTQDLALGENFLCYSMGLPNEAFRNPGTWLKMMESTLKVSDSASSTRLQKQTHWNSPGCH